MWEVHIMICHVNEMELFRVQKLLENVVLQTLETSVLKKKSDTETMTKKEIKNI